jgi:hypothetical protein
MRPTSLARPAFLFSRDEDEDAPPPRPDEEFASTESNSEDSAVEEFAPGGLLDQSDLKLGLRHWNPALGHAAGAGVMAEENAPAFSRFLWRLDVAVDSSQRELRATVASWLQCLLENGEARRQVFLIAARSEMEMPPRTMIDIYREMRAVLPAPGDGTQ